LVNYYSFAGAGAGAGAGAPVGKLNTLSDFILNKEHQCRIFFLKISLQLLAMESPKTPHFILSVQKLVKMQ
jgi:hypothetical protein|tara:strand:- start:134 stop:346 length:213 start_codon:yes stop_codon:yes gene_type:complete